MFIQRYCSELLSAKPPIISLIDEANQTSPVTLALKQNESYRMIYHQIWEIPNLDSVLQAMGGHLRLSGIYGFSGFLVIQIEENSKQLCYSRIQCV
jgi:hypothetical protein